MRNIIAFDMDGTLADLYSVPNWLEKLQNEDSSPYSEAEPLVDMDRLNEVCELLQKAGYEIQIITALCKNASKEYKQAIREAKKVWLEKWGFIYDHFHGVDYKTPKYEVIRRDMKEGGTAILIDDETRQTDKWYWGETINPTECDVIEALINLLKEDEI